MAQIVPIDTARALRISADQDTSRDPFDVVVFLNHFLESDRYPDAILSQISSAPEAAPAQVARSERAPSPHLCMQLGQHSLTFTLGRG